MEELFSHNRYLSRQIPLASDSRLHYSLNAVNEPAKKIQQTAW